MISRVEYLAAVEVVKNYRNQLIEQLKEVEATNNRLLKPIPNVKIIYKPESKLSEVETTTKIRNTFRGAYGREYTDVTLEQISNVTERELLRWRNVGHKTIIEIENLLNKAGLTIKK